MPPDAAHPAPLPVPTPDPLEARWRDLVATARAEYWRAGLDPNDYFWSLWELRLLRGRLTEPPAEEWYSRAVLDAELAGADLAALATDFFGAYRAARARRAG